MKTQNKQNKREERFEKVVEYQDKDVDRFECFIFGLWIGLTIFFSVEDAIINDGFTWWFFAWVILTIILPTLIFLREFYLTRKVYYRRIK